MSENHFTIHYRDGRVEGPIGAKVVRDLLRAGIISPHDSLALPGGAPMPVTSIYEFQDIVGGQQQAQPQGLRPMPSGLRPMQGGPPPAEDMSDRTVQMEIPAGGFHPMAIQAEIERRKAEVARKKATPPPQPVVARAQPPIEEDLFAAAPAVKRTPLRQGASYQSSSNLPGQSISIKNPFAGRSPSGGRGPSKPDHGFSQALSRLTAAELRDKLLSMPPHQILDVELGCNPLQAQSAYEIRHGQVQEHPDAKGSSIIGRAAIEDLINVIESARDVLVDANRVHDYQAKAAEAGFDPPLNKYIDFRFAAVKPITSPIEGPKPMPGQSATSSGNRQAFSSSLPTSSALDISKFKQPSSGAHTPPGVANTFGSDSYSNPLASGPNQPPRGTPASKLSTVGPAPQLSGSYPAPKLSGVQPAPQLSGVMNSPFTSGSRPAGARSSQSRKSGARKKETKDSQKKKKPLSKAAQARQKRKDTFKKAGWGEKGDPFSGHLAFGVGRKERGLMHVLGMYGLVFIVSFVLISVTDFGIKEFNVVTDEPMIFIRSGLLFFMGLVGIMAVRRESIARIGIAPELIPAAIAIPMAGLIGFLAMPIARLDVAADANLGVVIGLLAVRAIGEGVFFHGFVTRTLLIEMKEPATAMFISALLYGFYALTFVVILGGSPINIIFGILVYGFGSGMPLAVMYWKTRSFFIPIIAELIILVLVAIAGMQHSAGYGVAG